jgi:hypothetical protein
MRTSPICFLLVGSLVGCGAAPPQAPTPEVVVATPTEGTDSPTGKPHAPKAVPTLPGPKVAELPGTSIRFIGGDGSSKERAVKIMGAKGESDGVAAEYQYLDLTLGKGTWKTEGQALLQVNGAKVDELDITTSEGKKSVYFDITDYFGKF